MMEETVFIGSSNGNIVQSYRLALIAVSSIFLVSCGPIQATNTENMGDSERFGFLSSKTDTDLCKKYNNSFIKKNTERQIEQILRERKIGSCDAMFKIRVIPADRDELKLQEEARQEAARKAEQLKQKARTLIRESTVMSFVATSASAQSKLDYCRAFARAIEAVAEARDNLGDPSWERLVELHPILKGDPMNEEPARYAFIIYEQVLNINATPHALMLDSFSGCLKNIQ
ncbi:MAG: hypothetical protein D4R63_11955 [Methylococcaceae bacterium]|nr:MAG: hypothetical protein D4R63_11955 [Methylococcaceae bacterium]